MGSLDEPYLPRDGANNHDVRLHHRPLRAFEDSIVADLTFAREEKVDLSVPSLLAATAAGGDSGLIRAGGLVRIKGHSLGRYGLVLRAAVNGRDVREGRLEGLVISA